MYKVNLVVSVFVTCMDKISYALQPEANLSHWAPFPACLPAALGGPHGAIVVHTQAHTSDRRTETRPTPVLLTLLLHIRYSRRRTEALWSESLSALRDVCSFLGETSKWVFTRMFRGEKTCLEYVDLLRVLRLFSFFNWHFKSIFKCVFVGEVILSHLLQLWRSSWIRVLKVCITARRLLSFRSPQVDLSGVKDDTRNLLFHAPSFIEPVSLY